MKRTYLVLTLSLMLGGLTATAHAGVHVNSNSCTPGAVNQQGTICAKSCNQQYNDPSQQLNCYQSCCTLVIPSLCPSDPGAVQQCLDTANGYKGKGN